MEQQDSLRSCTSVTSQRSSSAASAKKPQPHSEADRHKHDIQQAMAMRRRKKPAAKASSSPSSSTPVKDNAEVLALGLQGLEEADKLRIQGRHQAALDLYQSAIEVLIRLMPIDSSLHCCDKDALQGRVRVALSHAEQLKELLRTRQTTGEASAADSPLNKTCFKRISQYLASVRDGSPKQQQQQQQQQQQVVRKPAHSTPQQYNRNAAAASSRSIQSQNSNKNNTQAISPSAASASLLLASKEADMLSKTVLDDMYVPPSQLQSTTWDDIAGLAGAKQALQEAAIMPLVRPDLFTGLRKPQNILLYGSPGTGKTLLVKAVACESGCSLFLCTASAITSKWHGDSEKLVRALFRVAQQYAPSIIFIDEIDALLSTRKSEGEHEASRRFKTEFMVQMDGISPSANSDSANNILLISCTNCPWDVDSAVLRRFSRRIFVPLPDTDARKALIKGLLKKAGRHSLNKSEISDIVKRLKGFSGSDIQSIASEASFGPLRSVGSLDAIRNIKAKDVRPISMDDFDNAIGQATKSVSKEQLAKYDDWKKKQSAS